MEMVLEEDKASRETKRHHNPDQKHGIDFRESIQVHHPGDHRFRPSHSLSEGRADILTSMSKEPSFSTYIQAGMVMVLAAFLARGCINLWSQNYNIAVEANGLYGILEVADGRALYPAHSEKPYQNYLYGPVHGFLLGKLLRVLGIDTLRGRVILIRLLSLAAFLVTFLIFWNLVKDYISPRGFTLALCLGFSKFADYVTSARNDSWGLLFEGLGLLCFVLWIRKKRKLHLSCFVIAIVVSLLTRQTGVAVFLSSLFWLLWRRSYGTAAWLALFVGGSALLICCGLNSMTSGAFVEQSILANIRHLRPVDHSFFDHSFLSFCASYVLFILLVVYGWYISRRQKEPEMAFFRILLIISFLGGCVALPRAGGDVNYFLESIFVGFLFGALALDDLGERLRHPVFTVALVLQLGLIAVVYGYKTFSTYRIAFYPYAEVAGRIRDRLGSFVFVGGLYAPNLIIYLRGVSFHGPDVSNASFVVINGHPKLRWILEDLAQSVQTSKIKAVVMAENQCARGGEPELPSQITAHLKEFRRREVWYPWLCVYLR